MTTDIIKEARNLFTYEVRDITRVYVNKVRVVMGVGLSYTTILISC